MHNILTLVQEVYCDLVDAKEEQHLRATKAMPEQFQGIDDWLDEQISKMSEIEDAIEEYLDHLKGERK